MLTTDHTPRPARTDLAAHPTHGITAAQPFVADAYSLLDHRTQAQTIPADGAPAGRYLAVEDGGEVRLLPLDRPVIHLGRGLVADVRLEDPHVSRRHAIVASRSDGVRILDDRSSNGTWVNGQSTTVAWLTDGDVVRIGRVALRYVEVAPRPATRWTPRARPSTTATRRDRDASAQSPRRSGTRPARRIPIAPARPRRSVGHAAP